MNVKGYVLHTRQFRETSLIVETLTESAGRQAVIARGVRGSKRTATRSLLQPFRPLLMSWRGRGNLPTLTNCEPAGVAYTLESTHLYAGLYANELLINLLQPGLPGEIFSVYERCLDALSRGAKIAPALRNFELELLDYLGYGFEFNQDTNGNAIEPEIHYSYVTLTGFTPIDGASTGGISVSGEQIIALSHRDWTRSGSTGLARVLGRSVIDHLLNGKKLHSRELVKSTKSVAGR